MILIISQDGDEFRVADLEAARKEILEIHATGTGIDSVMDEETGKQYGCSWDVKLEELEPEKSLTAEEIATIKRLVKPFGQMYDALYNDDYTTDGKVSAIESLVPLDAVEGKMGKIRQALDENVEDWVKLDNIEDILLGE